MTGYSNQDHNLPRIRHMITLDKETSEGLRQLKHEARRKMKEKQKTNPAYLAMKEVQKKMRQKASAYAKERAKKIRDAAKAAKKEAVSKFTQDKQATRERELMSHVISADELLKKNS